VPRCRRPGCTAVALLCYVFDLVSDLLRADLLHAMRSAASGATALASHDATASDIGLHAELRGRRQRTLTLASGAASFTLAE
jgi:hypothetical protein